MVSLRELNPHKYPTTPEIDKNLAVLHSRINQVRSIRPIPMIITSALRSVADQTRINPKAPKSNHLIGAAVDIADSDGSLAAWCLANEKLLESIGLWMEHPDYTKGWVHLQCVPPKSGKRYFRP